MPSYTYDPGLVFDNTTSQPARSAVGYLLDSAGGTPQPVYDLLGNLLPNLSTSPDGYLARFKADIPTGVVTFGAVGQPVISVEAQNSGVLAQKAVDQASASAFAAKQAQAAAEAVQTGSATTNASLLTSGTVDPARLPDLSGTYASASALSAVTTTANTASTTAGTAKSTADTAKSTADTAKSTADSALSTANATQAQQTQLMTVTPTVDELVGTTVITTWQSPGQAVTQNETAGGVHSIWIAPFPCRIVQATFLWDYWSLAANDTNYLTFQLRRNRALTYTTMVSKTTKVTGGEAVVQRVPWKFAGAAWDSAASTFAEGDVLVMQNSFTGTGLTHSFPLTMTWRYVPL